MSLRIAIAMLCSLALLGLQLGPSVSRLALLIGLWWLLAAWPWDRMQGTVSDQTGASSRRALFMVWMALPAWLAGLVLDAQNQAELLSHESLPGELLKILLGLVVLWLLQRGVLAACRQPSGLGRVGLAQLWLTLWMLVLPLAAWLQRLTTSGVADGQARGWQAWAEGTPLGCAHLWSRSLAWAKPGSATTGELLRLSHPAGCAFVLAGALMFAWLAGGLHRFVDQDNERGDESTGEELR